MLLKNRFSEAGKKKGMDVIMKTHTNNATYILNYPKWQSTETAKTIFNGIFNITFKLKNLCDYRDTLHFPPSIIILITISRLYFLDSLRI